MEVACATLASAESVPALLPVDLWWCAARACTDFFICLSGIWWPRRFGRRTGSSSRISRLLISWHSLWRTVTFVWTWWRHSFRDSRRMSRVQSSWRHCLTHLRSLSSIRADDWMERIDCLERTRCPLALIDTDHSRSGDLPSWDGTAAVPWFGSHYFHLGLGWNCHQHPKAYLTGASRRSQHPPLLSEQTRVRHSHFDLLLLCYLMILDHGSSTPTYQERITESPIRKLKGCLIRDSPLGCFCFSSQPVGHFLMDSKSADHYPANYFALISILICKVRFWRFLRLESNLITKWYSQESLGLLQMKWSRNAVADYYEPSYCPYIEHNGHHSLWMVVLTFGCCCFFAIEAALLTSFVRRWHQCWDNLLAWPAIQNCPGRRCIEVQVLEWLVARTLDSELFPRVGSIVAGFGSCVDSFVWPMPGFAARVRSRFGLDCPRSESRRRHYYFKEWRLLQHCPCSSGQSRAQVRQPARAADSSSYRVSQASLHCFLLDCQPVGEAAVAMGRKQATTASPRHSSCLERMTGGDSAEPAPALRSR